MGIIDYMLGMYGDAGIDKGVQNYNKMTQYLRAQKVYMALEPHEMLGF